MAERGISIPVSGGGLVRYGEETGSKFQIKPSQVVILIIIISLLGILLRFFMK